MTKTADAPDTTNEETPPRKNNVVRRLYDWVLHWADTPYGTPALFLLAFAESSFFPIPPDPLLMALAIGKRTRSLFYGLVCTLGSVLGGIAGYYIGMAALGELIVNLYGQSELYIDLKQRFEEYNFLAIFFAAVTPIPYKIFTIAAGAVGVPLIPFIAASIAGRGLRFMMVSGLIYWLGEPIRNFIDRYFNLLTILFMVLLIGGFVVVKLLA